MGQQYQPYYSKRFLCWDEQNRLLGVSDNKYLSCYQYDANGERTYKLTGGYASQNVSGNWRYYYQMSNATLYTSPYLVVTTKGYTKHYYAESERVASQVGKGRFAGVNVSLADSASTASKLLVATQSVGMDPQTGGTPSTPYLAYLGSLTDRTDSVPESYFYHPDHLGSASWITDSAGRPVQHLQYLPWGENFVDRRSSTFDGARFTFSAKEKDAETGYSYFGARYYNSDLSIWLSVDPMSDKYPSLSPYVYCANNPIKLVDPNGEEIDWVEKADGTIYWDENAHNQETTKKGETYLGKEGQRSVGTTVLNYHSDRTIDKQGTVLIMDWGEDVGTELVNTNKTFKEWELDFTNKSVDFMQSFYIFLISPINDAIVLATDHDFYGNPVTKEDKLWAGAGLLTFSTGKTLKALRLFDKVKKTKKTELIIEGTGTALDVNSSRELHKKNKKKKSANEKQ